MIEAAGRSHLLLKRLLARMAEWGMANIMRKAEGLGKVFVQTQRPGKGTADLGHFQTMRQADPEMVSVRSNENLRLVPKPAEGNGVNDPIAVALKGVARATVRLFPLGMPPTDSADRVGGVRDKVHRPSGLPPRL